MDRLGLGGPVHGHYPRIAHDHVHSRRLNRIGDDCPHGGPANLLKVRAVSVPPRRAAIQIVSCCKKIALYRQNYEFVLIFPPCQIVRRATEFETSAPCA